MIALTSPARADEAGCQKSGCHDEVKADPKHAARLKCEQCHPNVKGDEHKDALSDFPPEQMCGQSGCHEAAVKNVAEHKHSDASCEQCHGFIHEDFKLLDVGVCKGCHKEAVAKFNTGVHAREASCEDCHGDIHVAQTWKDPLSPTSKVMQMETCAECHGLHEVRAFRTSAHGRAVLLSGLDVAPTCSTCHGGHEMKKVADPESRVAKKNVPETCGSCHKFILAAYKESVHAAMLAKGEKAPVCINCHKSHGVADLALGRNRLDIVEECGECHKEKHETYRDSFHGKATKLGLSVAATCSDCHTPHRMLPKDNPKSSVNPANVRATCEKCHQNVTDSFLKFDPHVNPANPRDNPTIHWIWLFMTLLLVGTLAFFALHTMLWLQRAIVAFKRKELRPEPHDGEVWIRRFLPIHSYIHLAIIVTFLLLAFTGLPLKFASQTWAGPLSNIVGGPGGARWLHRVAGVLTFGYAIVFVGYLLREIVAKGRRELLWGWQSMVPNAKDLKDLIGNLRWFLYLGPRPKLDRWAYWEKFDFFAVFWGIPVIGFSGLMLWFPQVATRLLPGWALNIAYLVHSDEALLATGFIFFFHFFHTHLRPEAFPLDPVIFIGAVPLERFKHERAAEYERLEQSGELKNYIVPAPTEKARTHAQTFGFLALGVGVVLGIALMITGVHLLGSYFGH